MKSASFFSKCAGKYCRKVSSNKNHHLNIEFLTQFLHFVYSAGKCTFIRKRLKSHMLKILKTKISRFLFSKYLTEKISDRKVFMILSKILHFAYHQIGQMFFHRNEKGKALFHSLGRFLRYKLYTLLNNLLCCCAP